MHVLAAQPGRIDDGEEAVDLAQSPGDIVVLSAADTELAGLAEAAPTLDGIASLRLASLISLSHPYSIDLYVESTLRQAKLIVARVLGGRGYWSYGLDRLAEIAAAHGIRLVLLPGDAKPDRELTAACNVAARECEALWRCLVEGGAENYRIFLAHCAHLIDRCERPGPARPLPGFGCLMGGMISDDVAAIAAGLDRSRPAAPIVFYRALVQAAQTGAIEALAEQLRERGLEPLPVFVASLKEPDSAGFVDRLFAAVGPAVVLNATAFALSKGGGRHRPTPLDRPGAPVLQVVLSGSSRQAWQESARGLSVRDLTMNVVLPELDGRILTRAVSFKADQGRDPVTQFRVQRPVPDRERIAFVSALAANWARLSRKPAAERRIALVLANYPNRDGRIANGVGLDTPASALAIMRDLKNAGYLVENEPESGNALVERLIAGRTNRTGSGDTCEATPAPEVTTGLRPPHANETTNGRRNGLAAATPPSFPRSPEPIHTRSPAGSAGGAASTRASSGPARRDRHVGIGSRLRGNDGSEQRSGPISGAVPPTLAHVPQSQEARDLGGCGDATRHTVSDQDYRVFFGKYPEGLRNRVDERWAGPERDPFWNGAGFDLPAVLFGNVAVCIQPARGYNIDPKETYHDPALVPPHGYLAFHAWLREVFRADAVVHVGKHGNLEWLPGKALALSAECFPEAALGALPNVYPFIVNDPGEGSQAKRRTSAVIVDHLTPPMTRAESYGAIRELELLIDEFYLASSTDPRRAAHLEKEILQLAASHGIDRDLGMAAEPGGRAVLQALDAHLCDLKELQIRDGLHVLGEAPRGRQRTDLIVSLARVPRGAAPEEASLTRAIAADLGLDPFDPLDCAFEADWIGPRPDCLTEVSDDLWRSAGDTVERIELLAARLVSGELQPPADWPATRAALAGIEADVIRRLDVSGEAERHAVLAALDGRFVEPGPSGAPSRGRPDVLPTGRNFYSVDVRAVPSEAAWRLGAESAERLARRYFEDEGEWPRALVVTCWGTSNMRTGGDDIAQALALIGARPVWEKGTGRVTGFEVVSLSELKRPRIDVTLRISGFFRDAFAHQIDLFDSAVRAIAERDEPAGANPIAAAVAREAGAYAAAGMPEDRARRRAGFRVYGSMPGAYGAGLQALIDEKIWSERADFAEAFLAWGGFAYGGGAEGETARDGLETRLGRADAVVQNQDNREHDLLDSDDYYQFEGGLAATVETLKGAAPRIYHNDHSRPERPVIRSLAEELARVVRGRAANPKWIAGVMRHGYKGAFEMAATVDYLFAFAATTDAVKDHHFDQLYAAYLQDEAVRGFMADNNALALQEMAGRFLEAIGRGLWQPKSNSARGDLERLAGAAADTRRFET